VAEAAEQAEETDPTRFEAGGTFSSLSRSDRLEALALLDERAVDTARLPGPVSESSGALVPQLLVAFTEGIYHSEWQGYEEFTGPPIEREFPGTVNGERLQSWQQTDFPGVIDGASASGFTFGNDPADAPWDTIGRLAGPKLKRVLSRYRQALPVLVVTDDRPRKRNGVSVAPGIEDEHGPIPQVNYVPSKGDVRRRDELTEVATNILKEAGADHVHRSDSPATAIHIHSTMAMGKVVDTACEAYDVDRPFVADHSALANGVGDPNPTNTGQSLALRTAERIADRYFDCLTDPIGSA
jgi:hypothetical protein